ncbi:MAG: aminotransferase class IV [Chitinophagaceae bacterium]
MNWLNFNGKIVAENEPIFTASNRGFKYGDGIFETIKVTSGKICLDLFHFERLRNSLQLLQLNSDLFTNNFLEKSIIHLCLKNNCEASARIRLAVYREERTKASFILEAIPLKNEITEWNETGWKLGVYPLARKSCDAFANLKSANFLPYLMAQSYALEMDCDEMLVLNSHDNIADGSKTNLFFIKEKEVYTPSLQEGCVAGVMRRAVIEECNKLLIPTHQTAISPAMVADADDVFITNAIQGIKWVSQFNQKKYLGMEARMLYQKLVKSNFNFN